MNCIKCGFELASEAKVCSACGTAQTPVPALEPVQSDMGSKAKPKSRAKPKAALAPSPSPEPVQTGKAPKAKKPAALPAATPKSRAKPKVEAAAQALPEPVAKPVAVDQAATEQPAVLPTAAPKSRAKTKTEAAPVAVPEPVAKPVEVEQAATAQPVALPTARPKSKAKPKVESEPMPVAEPLTQPAVKLTVKAVQIGPAASARSSVLPLPKPAPKPMDKPKAEPALEPVPELLIEPMQAAAAVETVPLPRPEIIAPQLEAATQPELIDEVPEHPEKPQSNLFAIVVGVLLLLVGAYGYWALNSGAGHGGHQPATTHGAPAAHGAQDAHGAADAQGHATAHEAPSDHAAPADHADPHAKAPATAADLAWEIRQAEIMKQNGINVLRDAEMRYDAKQKVKRLNPSPLFVELPPNDGNILKEFTLNLADKGGKSYLQTKVALETMDVIGQTQIINFMPVLTSKIIAMLGSRTLKEASTMAGKVAIAEDLTLVVNAVLDPQMTLIFLLQSKPTDAEILALEKMGAIPKRLDDGTRCCTQEMRDAALHFPALTNADLPVQRTMFKTFILQ